MKEYFKLAVGNLSHRKTRSLLTMIGIIIGITAVIALISLGQGLKTAVSAQFSALGSDRIIIEAKGSNFGPPGQNAAAQLTKDDLEVVQRAQYVKVAAGRIIKTVTYEFNNRERNFFLASMPDDREEERAVIFELTKPKVSEGRLLDINDKYKVMVGSNWGTENSFGKPMHAGDKIKINNRSVEVVGILESTGNPLFDEFIVMNEEPFRDLLDVPEEYSVITGKVENEQVMDLAIDAVTRDMRRARGLKIRQEDFTVESSAQLVESILSIIDVVNAVLFGIAAISLIVGGIGIMNTMYTSVLERTREIGIMKSIGATRHIILTVFLIEAGILGLIGGGIGIAFGVTLSKLVEIAAAAALGPGLLQTNISLGLIIGALLFSLFVGILSGIMPAIQASKMEPVEALNA